jgi:hypothetical protein
MDRLDEEEFVKHLIDLRTNDYDTFIQLVMNSLKTFPEFAVEDDAPTDIKKAALKVILNHLEEKEEYEDCAFVRDLQKKIDDAEKG